LYEDLFYTALARFRDEEGLGARKKKFRFKNKLLSLDSMRSTSVCGTPSDSIRSFTVPTSRKWQGNSMNRRSGGRKSFGLGVETETGLSHAFIVSLAYLAS
jgi:hypothetical protein